MKMNVFKRVLESAVQRWKLDPDQTYVLVKWYRDDDYHAVFCTDCNGDDDEFYLICTEKKVNSINLKNPVPATFYICDDAVRKEHAVHDTMKLSNFVDSKFMDDFGQVKVLIATEEMPKNLIVDIDPFKTTLISGVDDAKVLVINVDGRDSGEYVEDDKFTGPDDLTRSRDFDPDPAKEKDLLYAPSSGDDCCCASAIPSACACDDVVAPAPVPFAGGEAGEAAGESLPECKLNDYSEDGCCPSSL